MLRSPGRRRLHPQERQHRQRREEEELKLEMAVVFDLEGGEPAENPATHAACGSAVSRQAAKKNARAESGNVARKIALETVSGSAPAAMNGKAATACRTVGSE